ncbi:type I-E CRISPR-associated protein Cas7/Cse4/CasC [Aeromonas sp. R6-2]|uniref:type I-E CRISPR-associated protein Cas7/Cse4/CasC n=1 Tax=unclassified Aeromonas TaxID=257493 RepID=UPI0034A567A3
MTLFVELHLIQNFAPSNLNRDDTGAPKDALFGGQRRARLSSQCQKKSVRDLFKTSNLVEAEHLGTRTRHLDRLVKEELEKIGVTTTSTFNEIIKQALKKKKGKEEKETDREDEASPEATLSYLLYISMPEVNALKELISSHSEEIVSLSNKKKLKPTDISKQLKSELEALLHRSRAVDIALFGRMLADLPQVNQDAACQVAHAISTHRVERDFDYFTAVDDVGGPDETGAGMIGQVEFNSATFYRYAALDVSKLLNNLQEDKELTASAIEALIQAMVRAIPTGKQNSFAAHNLPEFIGVSLRKSPLNLANAFERPVQPRHDKSLTEQSVAALADYERKLAPVYGDAGDRWAHIDLTGKWQLESSLARGSVSDLAAWVRDAVETQWEE